MANGKALFELGKIVATPGAIAAAPIDRLAQFVARHAAGDWGDMCEDDKLANQAALTGEGERLMSGYYLGAGEGNERPKLWIITEWDRSVTTLLLPEEY